MTAPDHTIEPLKNFLHERGHPHMGIPRRSKSAKVVLVQTPKEYSGLLYFDNTKGEFPGPNVQSDDEFLRAATERGTTTFHPGCTCRMGPADSTWAVVDDQ